MSLATNAASMRDSNRKLILNLLRLEPRSRADLAEITGLTRASVTQIIDELSADGLVEELSVIESNTLGRKRTRLAICHNARYVFGVSIHRNRCFVGITDLYGDIKKQENFSIGNEAPEAVIEEISARIDSIRRKAKIKKELIQGIGVSAPGPVDYINGTVLNPPNFGEWHNVPICQILSERTGFTVYLEKDSNARALEERFFGAARDCESFMLLQIGGGVGAGVMTRDKLYRGSRGLGTELGHMSINMEGPECSCGGKGCLEGYLGRLLSGSGFESWRELMLSAGDSDADSLIDEAAEYLSVAIVNAFNLYDIEKVLLVGSDFAGTSEPLISRINGMAASRIFIKDKHENEAVCEGSTVGSCRTGATAMLYSVFCERE